MCRVVAESSLEEGGNNFAAGLNDGILYLMAFPYILIAVVAFFWYRQKRAVRAS